MTKNEFKKITKTYSKMTIEYFFISYFLLSILYCQIVPNITMKIIGNGTIALFSKYLSPKYEGEVPYKINLDGEDKFGIKDYIYLNEMKVHEIKIFWDKAIDTTRNMFYNNENITELDFSNFDTSEVTEMDSMFRGCSSLTSINLNNINTKLVKTMSWMFSGCVNLTSINLPNLRALNLIRIDYMFYNCKNLKILNLSNFTAPSLTTIAELFYECKNLLSFDLSNFNSSLLSPLENILPVGCKKIIYIDLSNLNAPNITSMSSLFNGYKSLLTVNLFNLNAIKLRSIYVTFQTNTPPPP